MQREARRKKGKVCRLRHMKRGMEKGLSSVYYVFVGIRVGTGRDFKAIYSMTCSGGILLIFKVLFLSYSLHSVSFCICFNDIIFQ